MRLSRWRAVSGGLVVALISACDGGSSPDDTDDTSDASDCEAGDTRDGTSACGPNGRGLLQQACDDGAWADTTTCLGDDDVCVDDATRPGPTTCGLNGDGLLSQLCTAGQWVDTTTCVDLDVCVDASVEIVGACGSFGDGGLPEECVDGQWEARPCDDPAHLARIDDLYPGDAPRSAQIDWHATVGSVLFYAASTEAYGRELWRTDGTAAGTTLVKDLRSGPDNGVTADDPVVVGSTLYFTTATGSGISESPDELWKTDGTAAGTVLVKDINPDGPSSPSELTAFGGQVYFVARDVLGDDATLWKSDGTAAGTTEVTADPIGPYHLVVFDGKLYFGAADGNDDYVLWQSDGTANGTVVVNAGGGSTPVPYDPYDLFAGAGRLWFVADADHGHGYELWVSDGTAAGTAPLHTTGGDTFFGSWDRFEPVASGSTIVFAAQDKAGADGIELWTTDGTASGTHEHDLFDGADSSSPSWLTAHGGAVYFTASVGDGPGLWRWSVPATVGTIELVSGPSAFTEPCCLVETGGVLYATAGEYIDEMTNDRRLWKVEGTVATEVADLAPGADLSYVRAIATLGTRLLLLDEQDAVGGAWYVREGTAVSFVRRLDEAGMSSYPRSAVALGDTFVFLATAPVFEGGYYLFATDGTPGSAERVKVWSANGDEISGFGVLGGHAYFELDDDLWRTDGTEVGTTLVKADLGLTGGYVNEWETVNGKLFFAFADGYTVNQRLWQTDGTTDGTVQVRRWDGDSQPNPPIVAPFYFTPVGDELYFNGQRSDGTSTIWVTDGDGYAHSDTICSIFPAQEIGAGVDGVYYQRGYDTHATVFVHGDTCVVLDAMATYARGFTRVGAYTVFAATHPTAGVELFSADFASVALLWDIDPGSESSQPTGFTVAGADAYFSASHFGVGRELYATDGTQGGTRLVLDIRPGLESSGPQYFFSGLGKIWFVANDGVHGEELWVSEGTAETTRMVADLVAGPGTSSPEPLAAFRDRVLFVADDGVHGRELWATDGTAAGTLLVADANPGALGIFPTDAVVGPDAVFLKGTDASGAEPWALTFE